VGLRQGQAWVRVQQTMNVFDKMCIRAEALRHGIIMLSSLQAHRDLFSIDIPFVSSSASSFIHSFID
jgi:hypothetical protein